MYMFSLSHYIQAFSYAHLHHVSRYTIIFDYISILTQVYGIWEKNPGISFTISYIVTPCDAEFLNVDEPSIYKLYVNMIIFVQCIFSVSSNE